MNASRSRREVTSETSIFDTDNGPSYARLSRWLVRHIISGPLIASSLAGGQRIEARGPKAHASCQSEPSPPPLPQEGRGDLSASSTFSLPLPGFVPRCSSDSALFS